MILKKGEKIHVIHRRNFEKEAQRHFVGVVDSYENGVARVSGHVYAVDSARFSFVRRPERRTRIISLVSGELIENGLPASVELERVEYRQENKGIRVTDGSDWHLDISEHAWS
jgi:hypothetical protein